MKPTDVIHPSWKPVTSELYKDALQKLNTEILPEIPYCPQRNQIFRVFEQPLSQVKVVILGQEPYPMPQNANGLAFAVNSNVKIPASLEIIAKEIENEGLKSGFFDSDIPEWRTLEHWQEQGVFLLNTALTTHVGKLGSHLHYWKDFTKRVVWFIAMNQPCIWLLWGKKAQEYSLYLPTKSTFNVRGYTRISIEEIPINPHFNYVLKAAHPAAEVWNTNKDIPVGFLGCEHFYLTNRILYLKGQTPINW